MKRLTATTLTIITLLTSISAHAEFRLKRHFTDDMVIQRDKPVTISGIADKGANVTVEFAGQKKSSKADADGTWSVALAPMPASAKGQDLTASCKNQKSRIKDVMVGDVFLVARQTTIDISLGRDDAGKKAASSHKKNPLFRSIVITTVPAYRPQADLAAEATTGWAEVNSKSASRMTAASYYLGRDLAADAGVPVGIIDVNLGHQFPVSWISRKALEDTEKFYGKSDIPGQLSRFDTMAELTATNGPMPRKGNLTSNFVNHAMCPAAGYNALLNPLKGLALKAALVQLGNDYPYMIYAGMEKDGTQFDRPKLNKAYVNTYDIRKVGFRMESVTMPRVPREWRLALGDLELPFALILPPGSDLNTLGLHHRGMRELHRQTSLNNPAIGLVLPGSENIPYSAQPQDEELLAKRCLTWVKGDVYGESGVPATGPLFKEMVPSFNEATIHFEAGSAKGLKAEGDALDYFEAAGVEGDYSPVKARIDGETIHIVSDTVQRIVRVRYNWNKRPDQSLLNAAGLPALPFRSDNSEGYDWFVTNKDGDLPEEYFTPANEWKKNDVTLINGQLKIHGYGNFTGWLGPIGVRTGPFGPNMGVREVKAGSPADGKVIVGDVIYSANKNMLGDKAWEVMGAAITESETREAGGKLVLGIRRGSDNIDVEIQLQVMGTYSPTAPYDCPKTERIVANLKTWVLENGAQAGFLNTDALFMLGSGDPELLAQVRRIVYGIMKGKDPNRPIDPLKAGKSWHNSAEAVLLGEYYLATGDREVLPHLKHVCDRLAATQNKQEGGWRHNFPGGATYGLIPNAGLPGVMGMYFATEAGLDINTMEYRRAVDHFRNQRAETGFLIYGFGGCTRPVPAPIDPAAMEAGKLTSYNGGLSAAGILMRFTENDRAAHLCSFISAHAWNNTFGGHGGNFWNNFWTPLGAHDHGKAAFIKFWKNHRWYRECNRMYDGSLIQNQGGGVGAACGLALVAPKQRLQITGAPTSPFSENAPPYLKPALDAYWNGDYVRCGKMVKDMITEGTVGKDDLPTAEYLIRAAREIPASLEIDPSTVAKPSSTKPVAKETPAKPREWQWLVTKMKADGRGNPTSGQVPNEEANRWRIKVVEDLSAAPEGWATPKFDDSGWGETALPVSWRMYHTALLRTKFNVEDKKKFDLLKFHGWSFRQQGIEIYLNGELIGKVNNLEKKTGFIENDFKASALKHLKNGENTLAVTTRHNWRWGMLFMKVYNDGYDFSLAGRIAE